VEGVTDIYFIRNSLVDEKMISQGHPAHKNLCHLLP